MSKHCNIVSLYFIAMKTLRSMSQLRWWVLAWFALHLGAAIASPIVQPKLMEMICSSAGALKIITQSADGSVALGDVGMDCSLCLLGSSAPVTTHVQLPALAPQAGAPVIQGHVFAVIVMATPPPARAPPPYFS